MAALSPSLGPALAPSPSNGLAASDAQLNALRVPTIVFLSLAVLVIVISILLVWRHLYRTWRNVIPEEADAADNLAAQQDKELSLIESQLNRTTPIVVLQPDSKVMCAHKDQMFMEATKLNALDAEGPDGLPSPFDITASTPRDPTATPVITDLSALPADSAAMPRSASAGALHDRGFSRSGSLYRSPGQAGSSSSLHSQGMHAEHGDDGGFHFRQPSFGQGQQRFSDRHRNSSAVSLASLAGSDVSTCSTTYVTELPEGSSLFYEGPSEYEP